MIAVTPVTRTLDAPRDAAHMSPSGRPSRPQKFFEAPHSVTVGKYRATIVYAPPSGAGQKGADFALISERRGFFEKLFGLRKGISWNGARFLTTRESRAYRKVEALYAATAAPPDGASVDGPQCLRKMRQLMTLLGNPTAGVQTLQQMAKQDGTWRAEEVEDVMIVPAVADAVWKDKATLRGLVEKCKTIEDILVLARTYPFDAVEVQGVEAHARGLGAMLDDDAIAESVAKVAASAVSNLGLTEALKAIAPIANSPFTRSRLLSNGWGEFRSTVLYEALCDKVSGYDDAMAFAKAFPYTYDSCIEVILSNRKVMDAVKNAIHRDFATGVSAGATLALSAAQLKNLNSLATFVSGSNSADPSLNLRLSNTALKLVWADEAISRSLRSAILRCDATGNIDVVKPLLLTHPDKRFVELMLDPKSGYVPPTVIGDPKTTTNYHGLKSAVQRDPQGGGSGVDGIGLFSLLGS